MSEQKISQLFQHDFSEGTEAFRDELLERCLSELGSDSDFDEEELHDDVLEMLAAAGDPALMHKPPQL